MLDKLLTLMKELYNIMKLQLIILPLNTGLG